MWVSDYRGHTIEKQRCCLYLQKWSLEWLDTLKLRSEIQHFLKRKWKLIAWLWIFSESCCPDLFGSTWSCSIPVALLKSQKGEMDTLTPEYCNLLVVGGHFLQVCRLECKNASCCVRAEGALQKKQEEMVVGHYSPFSDQVSYIQIYPNCIMAHLSTNATQTRRQNT